MQRRFGAGDCNTGPISYQPELARVPSDMIRAALVRRLRTSSGISDDDVKEIEQLPIAVRQYPAETPVVRDGERATDCCLIADGFCARSKTIPSGKRQILSIHIPGEIPDLMSLFLHVMDHDLSTLTPCTLGFIRHETLRKLHQRSPSVAELFWRDTLIDSAMFREWIVNVGQRPAPARLAHVMIELRERLRVIERLDGNSFEMPLTQEQIGEALGITAVHANRVIKQLRQEGIVELHRGRVTVLDERKFLELADFDGRYLHQSPTL
ncbi:CRP-like cAMP-binding protein [Bradyrhizobium japonicum]|uniref:Crp/Fnr family transcriptional regulator n=1 Tax=Bradyrhizobium sp. NL2 TaxID=3082951 RepID=UPI001845BEB2|nr:Crp/Fnr family transcriptional regulator [Bradyrhizobium japonicum]MCP1767021.1 CRP-like cAMP-binding protein [Bradyrhizobium japonicum]MCP1789160.1 CRP-like cAMP-binding protein [Bradyrhizobium japonicum]MCP1801659.1 CRP-like cAMP-binding protein [Bradyrhizobium japonicum]MCP1819968.1 CRP-like cAMP-binding protein [Bradyrhizobium japonicum]MCP1868522.1 CRP-like cAMP-binding protein [Bradyrhizobium japonicum]